MINPSVSRQTEIENAPIHSVASPGIETPPFILVQGIGRLPGFDRKFAHGVDLGYVLGLDHDSFPVVAD